MKGLFVLGAVLFFSTVVHAQISDGGITRSEYNSHDHGKTDVENAAAILESDKCEHLTSKKLIIDDSEYVLTGSLCISKERPTMSLEKYIEDGGNNFYSSPINVFEKVAGKTVLLTADLKVSKGSNNAATTPSGNDWQPKDYRPLDEK